MDTINKKSDSDRKEGDRTTKGITRLKKHFPSKMKRYEHIYSLRRKKQRTDNG
jgi:hypothetical protein